MNNVRRFKRSIIHWMPSANEEKTACGRKARPGTATRVNFAKVSCKTCRDMLAVSGKLAPQNKRSSVHSIETGHRIDISETDKLITAGIRAVESEIQGSIAQANRAIENSLLPRAPGVIIGELRTALQRLLKLIQLLG